MVETLPFQTPPLRQVWKCSDCGRTFRLQPAYGSRAMRPMLSALRSRFNSHECTAVNETEGERNG